MNRRLYISAKAEVRRKMQESMSRKYQFIYTDKIEDANYVVIVKENGEVTDEQFLEVAIAKENGSKITYIEQAQKSKQMHDTRKKFDMEIE